MKEIAEFGFDYTLLVRVRINLMHTLLWEQKKIFDIEKFVAFTERLINGWLYKKANFFELELIFQKKQQIFMV